MNRSASAEFDPVRMPTRHAWLVDRFTRYVQWHLGRHFDAVRMLNDGRRVLSALPDDRPVIVYSNHPGWWDPLIGVAVTAGCLPGRKTYAPIDAAMLDKYKVFGKLGFFGIDSDSRRGGAAFLRTSDAVLLEPAAPRNAIWITAEGFFSDPRKRPIELRPGVAHLAARRPEAVVVPVAIEYPFWTERQPEALVATGEVIDPSREPSLDADTLESRCRAAMEATLDALAGPAIAKDAAKFETLIQGRAGLGSMYDVVRLMGAWARGKRFDARHLPDFTARGEHRHAH